MTLMERLLLMALSLFFNCGPLNSLRGEAAGYARYCRESLARLSDAGFFALTFVINITTAIRFRYGARAIDFVMGIVKAYTTRVGEGPFQLSLMMQMGDVSGNGGTNLGLSQDESGAAAGFDAALVRQTCSTSDVNGIALTKLDVLDGFETLRICIGYDLDGIRFDYLPFAADQQARCVPVYEDMPGWSESTEGARSWSRFTCKRH